MTTIKSFCLLLGITICFASPAMADSYSKARTLVEKALRKLAPQEKNLIFSYQQKHEQFGHLDKPWATYSQESAGLLAIAPAFHLVYQRDSSQSNGKYLTSQTLFLDTTLVVFPPGQIAPAKKTTEDLASYLYQLAAYSPAFLLQDFLRASAGTTFIRYARGTTDTIVYRRQDYTLVTLLVNPKQKEVIQAEIMYPHELYGDVRKIFQYQDYQQTPKGLYPTLVTTAQLGVETSRVHITMAAVPVDFPQLLKKIPAGYQVVKPQSTQVNLKHQTFQEGIHLLELKETDDRVLLVEFKDYLLVAEAPLSSTHGERILAYLKKAFPGKPVKYFVFGHHHPHYIGGIRAFVHNQTQILALPQNEAYVRQLVNFRHTLRPDALEKEPKTLQLETFEQERVLTDGNLEMRILHIGSQSKHTQDYLIYYFPKQKLLFQDDLAWIKADGVVRKPSARQKGLYEAIKARGLVVDTILQSWPVQDNGVKTIIPFKDLEESMKLQAPQ